MSSPNARLDTIPLLADLTPDERARLAAWFTERTVAAGEVILWEGRPHESLCVVDSGRFIVTKQIRGATEAVLATLDQGAHFGEIDLIDSRSASANVTAETAGRLLVLDQGRLRALLDADHRLFSALAWALLRDLAAKVRRTNEKLQETIVWGLDATASDPSQL
jgi:CRP-like cAMP-binding protein